MFLFTVGTACKELKQNFKNMFKLFHFSEETPEHVAEKTCRVYYILFSQTTHSFLLE